MHGGSGQNSERQVILREHFLELTGVSCSFCFMSRSFYQRFAEWLQQGPVALAVVINGQGSVPREVGAKMLVQPDGSTTGTIGGGAGEAKVMAAAAAVLASGQQQTITIDLTGAAQRPVEGVCGGWMQVWIDRWQPDQLPLVERLIEASTDSPLYWVVPLDGRRSYITEQLPAAVSNSYVERLQPSPLLLVVGAGHVGYALAQMASWIGFDVAVQDERLEFANYERFPTAISCCNDSIAQLLPQLPRNRDLYIALVTRGLSFDQAALEAVWASQIPYRYLGMIGSHKRVKTVMAALKDRGFLDGQMQSLCAPIGLPIHALTPEEIAVSICAQLIQIRRAPTSWQGYGGDG